jgi:polyhydroxybutyrate depolymerase
VVLLGIVVAAEAARFQTARAITQSIDVQGQTRTYNLYVPHHLPKNKKVPLVFVFHGGGGAGVNAERLTRFSDMADRGGFVVVYPNAFAKYWIDGRDDDITRAYAHIDDVAFIAALIDKLSRSHRIDANKIFATGYSNGGIFSHYLAAHLSDRIAAIAPVIGGIADPFDKSFKPDRPVSVLIMQSTHDRLVPFDGGGIDRGKRGKVISTKKTVKKWTAHNRCAEHAQSEDLPDKDTTDNCTVNRALWSCHGGTDVALYTLRGAGHTWPGGAQTDKQRKLGKVCHDIDATEVIWDFFKNHPKRAKDKK